MSDSNERDLSRREVLRRGAGVALAIPAAAAATALTACGEAQEAPKSSPPPTTPAAPSGGTTPPKTTMGTETPPASPASPAPSGVTLVTEVPAAATLVSSLQYTNESPHADKKCNNCQLYTAETDAYGKCQLFPQGKVADAGWCASWVEKQV